MTGLSRTQFLFTHHYDDIPGEKHSYGGGFGMARMSLRVLYDEYQRHHNRWTASNVELDLCRYRGVNLRFYREPEIDFVVTWSLNTPMTVDINSHMSMHPLLAMLGKRHVIVPSYKTRPRGRRYVSVTVGPPKLMLNKWYFTSQFCDVGLIFIKAMPCTLKWPWMDPQRTSPCVHFTILKMDVFSQYSILPDNDKKTARENIIKAITSTTKSIGGGTHQVAPAQCNMYNTLVRDNWSQFRKQGKVDPFDFEALGKTDTFRGSEFFQQEGAKAGQNITQKLWPCVYGSHSYVGQLDPTMYYRYGVFSHYFLTEKKLDPQIRGVTTRVGYNPMTDKGEGNMVWLNHLVNFSNTYNPKTSKCLIAGQPLWLALLGYESWAVKDLKDEGVWGSYVLCCRSPYTFPKMYRSSDPNWGEIPLGPSFCEGAMPGGLYPIPLEWRLKWYPMVLHQREWMNMIITCGPFMPRGFEQKNWNLTMGYRFKWLWGGQSRVPQTGRGPLRQTHPQPARPR